MSGKGKKNGKKAQIQSIGGRRSQAKGLLGMTNSLQNLGAPKRMSKRQDSAKVHNTKGKNTHGRRFW